MDQAKIDRPTLKKFGFLMALALVFISLLMLAQHKQAVATMLVAALSFMLIAIFSAGLLKYPYILWMKLGQILSWVNTRILLGIIFYLIFSPVGLFMRLFRIDLLKINSDSLIDSYWEPKAKEESLPVDYRRQS